MNPYVIIGSPNCVWCSRAKSLLMEKYSDYEYHDLSVNPWLMSLFKVANIKTVPQIFAPSGELIGGYEALEKHLKTHKADKWPYEDSGVEE